MGKAFWFALVSAVCAILALPVFAAPDPGAVVQRIYADVTTPGYMTLREKTAALKTAVDAHCGGAQTDDTAVITAFNEAMDAWQAVQHIRNGAVTAFNRHARLQFWPDKRGKVGKQLRQLIQRGDANSLVDLGKRSVAIQGFPALERLILSDSGLSTEVPPEDGLSTCAVARAIVANIAGIGNGLATAPPRTGPADETVRAYMTDLVTGLEAISRLKLDAPIGKKRARPRMSENWRSSRSLTNISINLMALENLYVALMGNDATSDTVARTLQSIRADIDDLRPSLADAVRSDVRRAQLIKISEALVAIRQHVAANITERLQLNLGFNSLDGD